MQRDPFYRRRVFTVVALVLMVAGAMVQAQDNPPSLPPREPVATVAPKASVDLVRLLQSPWVFASPYEDDVWTIAPQPGRRLVHVPLVIKAAEQAYELDSGVLDLRGGRFVAFHLQSDPLVAQGEQAASAVEQALPPGASLVSRKLTVQPDRTLTWKMERAIPGGVVRQVTTADDAAYVLKTDPRQMAQFEPARPENVQRNQGEDTRAFQYRKREAEVAHRAAQIAFRDLRQRVSDLPDTFTVPMPEVVWALFEVPEFSDDLVIDRSDAERWSNTISTLQMMREVVAMNRDEVANLPASRLNDIVQRLQGLVSDGHPLGERLAAYTADAADLARLAANPGDPVAVLLRTLLTADDREAKLTALSEVSSTIPPTRVTLALIKEFAGQFDPTMQLVALRGLLSAEVTDPQQMQGLLASANQMLADENGPPPAQVMGAMLETVTDTTRPALAQGVDFDALPDARRAGAIRAVAAAAPVQPLAAEWLNVKLLGSSRTSVVKQTVEILAAATVQPQAGASGDPVGPEAPTTSGEPGGPRNVFGGLIRRAWGTEDAEAPAAPTDGSTATTAAAAPGDDSGPLVLPGYITIDSVQHNYFLAIASPDQAIRDASWQALRCLALPVGLPPPAEGGYSPEHDPYALLVANARALAQVPTSVVPFFARQDDPPRVAWALVQIVLHSDDAAVKQAADALMGSTLPVADAVNALQLPERHTFARRLYGGVRNEQPLVTGLMRWNNPQNPFVAWLATAIAAGELPPANRWHEQVQPEDNLLLVALSTDRELALAGAAALASSVGGDDDQAREVAKKFDLITTRNAEGARPEWDIERRRILADRLRAAAGEYHMALQLYPAPDPAAPPPAEDAPLGDPVETIDLASIQLEPEGDALIMAAKTIKLSSTPDQFVIRVESLSELKNFPGERVQQLPLEQVDPQTLDLVSDGDGGWAGTFTLPTRAKARLQLTPGK